MLRDAHRQRRGEARVLLRLEAIRRELAGQRGIPDLFGDADPGPRQRGVRKPTVVRRRPGPGGSGRFVAVPRQADDRKRTIERRCGEIELSEELSCLRGAQPRVDHARRAAYPVGHTERVPARAVADGLFDQFREPFERLGAGLGAAPPVVGVRHPRLFADQRLEVFGGRPGRLRLRRPRFSYQRQGVVDFSARGSYARSVEEQERAPSRVRRILHALRQRLFARARVAGSRRQDFQGKPGAGAFGRGGPFDRRGCASTIFGLGRIRCDVRQVGGLHQQRAHLFVGSGGRRDEGVDQAAEVSQTPPLFEKTHQPFEGLVKGRIGAVGGQVVARRRRFLPDSFLGFAELGEQPRLTCGLGRREELRAEAPDGIGEGPLCLGREGRGNARRSRRQRLRRLADRGRIGHAQSRRGRATSLSASKGNLVTEPGA